MAALSHVLLPLYRHPDLSINLINDLVYLMGVLFHMSFPFPLSLFLLFFIQMDPVQKAVINHTFGVPLVKTKRPIISCNVCQIRFNSEVRLFDFTHVLFGVLRCSRTVFTVLRVGFRRNMSVVFMLNLLLSSPEIANGESSLKCCICKACQSWSLQYKVFFSFYD